MEFYTICTQWHSPRTIFFLCSTPLSMGRLSLYGKFSMRTNDSTIWCVCACVVFDIIHQLQFDCQLNLWFLEYQRKWERDLTSPVSLKHKSCTLNRAFRLENKQQWNSQRCDHSKILCVAQSNKSAKIYYSSLVYFTISYRRHNLYILFTLG